MGWAPVAQPWPWARGARVSGRLLHANPKIGSERQEKERDRGRRPWATRGSGVLRRRNSNVLLCRCIESIYI
eukprot:scaffold5905_cov132-Isochrysis_galbana.AAC.6